MLTLTASEMTVLVGGMRALNAKQISTATRILAEVIASDDRCCDRGCVRRARARRNELVRKSDDQSWRV